MAAWNTPGLALLVNVGVAVVSTPSWRRVGDDHVLTSVTCAPFVWRPTVMVLAAGAWRLVIFRALRRL